MSYVLRLGNKIETCHRCVFKNSNNYCILTAMEVGENSREGSKHYLCPLEKEEVDCVYCNNDSCNKPLVQDKNIGFWNILIDKGLNYRLHVSDKDRHTVAEIEFCPKCGRNLT